MKNKVYIILLFVAFLFSIDCHSQSVQAGRVAIYMDMDNSSYNDAKMHKNVRSTFHKVLESKGYEVAPDSTASQMAAEYRKSNAIRFGTNQVNGTPTNLLYIFSVDRYNEYIQLSVIVIDIERRKETQNTHSDISLKTMSNNPIKATELLTFEVAAELNLITSDTMKSTLKSLRKWESDIARAEQQTYETEQRRYTLTSFVPPLNQFRSHTSKGTANGIAILGGYGVSVGTFIWSTVSYNENRRKLDNISIDLTEAEKAREHYRNQMDICRGGQIASGILFIGTYIYGVANSLANRDHYQNKRDVTIAPTAYENGAGIALVYKF